MNDFLSEDGLIPMDSPHEYLDVFYDVYNGDTFRRNEMQLIRRFTTGGIFWLLKTPAETICDDAAIKERMAAVWNGGPFMGNEIQMYPIVPYDYAPKENLHMVELIYRKRINDLEQMQIEQYEEWESEDDDQWTVGDYQRGYVPRRPRTPEPFPEHVKQQIIDSIMAAIKKDVGNIRTGIFYNSEKRELSTCNFEGRCGIVPL